MSTGREERLRKKPQGEEGYEAESYGQGMGGRGPWQGNGTVA